MGLSLALSLTLALGLSLALGLTLALSLTLALLLRAPAVAAGRRALALRVLAGRTVLGRRGFSHALVLSGRLHCAGLSIGAFCWTGLSVFDMLGFCIRARLLRTLFVAL